MTYNKKIKVLHIITQLEWGGAQDNTVYTCQNLDKKIFECFLLTTPGRLSEELSDESKRTYQLKYLQYLVRPINPLKDILALFEIIKELKRIKPDIVHTHSSKAGIIGRISARWCKVPVIIHSIHGFGFNSNQPHIIRWIFILLERVVSRWTTKFIAVSKNNITTGIDKGIFSAEKTVLIRSGVKTSRFSRVSDLDVKHLKDAEGIPIDSPILGTVACFKPQKAPLDFIRTCAMISHILPLVHYIMIGDGELRKSAETRANKFGISHKIHFLGWRSNIEAWLNVFDVFLLTSKWEGLPRSIVEAMLTGLPVVATSVDGNAEIIQHNITGFLVPPGDYGGLAGYAIKCLRDSNLRDRIGTAAKKSITDEFDIDNMVKKQENLYTKLLILV